MQPKQLVPGWKPSKGEGEHVAAAAAEGGERRRKEENGGERAEGKGTGDDGELDYSIYFWQA
jgi:hypothetical protein